MNSGTYNNEIKFTNMFVFSVEQLLDKTDPSGRCPVWYCKQSGV